jgi:GNAT superfamily N-acetyltransferase
MTSVMTILNVMTSVMRVQGVVRAPSQISRSEQQIADVRILAGSALNVKAVLAMASRCSRNTLFHRFHGFTDGVAYFAALLRDPAGHETHLAWNEARCVGVATIALNAAGTADLGVLVEDRWQRQGIGTRLVASLLPRARDRGVTNLHADVLRDDMFVLEALSRVGPPSVSVELGAVSVDIKLDGALGRQR